VTSRIRGVSEEKNGDAISFGLLFGLVATSDKYVSAIVATLISEISRFYRRCCNVATSQGVHPILPFINLEKASPILKFETQNRP
jgi:hypothetical protein